MPIYGVTSSKEKYVLYKLIFYSGRRFYQYNEVELSFECLQAYLELQVYK